jgi:O-antigen/teichoic acid export membrane protein
MRKSIIDKIVTLTLSSFIIKALGFVFRIYLSGKLKAEGMGLYQLILSVYAFGATISVSGMSAAISRLTAIHEKHSDKILKTGLVITGIISLPIKSTHSSSSASHISLKDNALYVSKKTDSLAKEIILLIIGGILEL